LFNDKSAVRFTLSTVAFIFRSYLKIMANFPDTFLFSFKHTITAIAAAQAAVVAIIALI